MSGGVYLIKVGGELVEMTEQAYDSEDLPEDFEQGRTSPAPMTVEVGRGAERSRC